MILVHHNKQIKMFQNQHHPHEIQQGQLSHHMSVQVQTCFDTTLQNYLHQLYLLKHLLIEYQSLASRDQAQIKSYFQKNQQIDISMKMKLQKQRKQLHCKESNLIAVKSSQALSKMKIRQLQSHIRLYQNMECPKCTRLHSITRQKEQLEEEVIILRTLNTDLASKNNTYAMKLQQVLIAFKDINRTIVQKNQEGLCLQLESNQLLRSKECLEKEVQGLRKELGSNVEMTRFFREKVTGDSKREKEEFEKVLDLVKAKSSMFSDMQLQLNSVKQEIKLLSNENRQLTAVNCELREIASAYLDLNHRQEMQIKKLQNEDKLLGK